jgi:hypothetical protein
MLGETLPAWLSLGRNAQRQFGQALDSAVRDGEAIPGASSPNSFAVASSCVHPPIAEYDTAFIPAIEIGP